MSGIESAVRIKDAVEGLCKAIDAGEVHPTELEMVAFACVVVRDAGPMAHTLLCQLASRSEIGKKALKRASQ